ncbi:hypothetical protein KW443_09120 [Vibrio fluvialis]|nr:hypothetical protein [Vibrio fluvialis]
MKRQEFEKVLDDVCSALTLQLRSQTKKMTSADFEKLVRQATATALHKHDLSVDMAPPAQEFPDIVIDKFGIEIKYSEKDTWRSIANSIFESRRNTQVEHVYLLFGKNGGIPESKWNRYDDCIMHVRTSHVPRFEVEINTSSPLFPKLGISYEDFRTLPLTEKMPFIREYARGRMKPGERLWWIEDSDEPHTLSLEVKLYTKLESEEKIKLRAESALLCPQIVKGSRVKGKYDDATLYLLTYHGVLCNQARDLFSAGSVAMRSNQERGGNYLMRALQDIEPYIQAASVYLEDKLFEEYWGEKIPPEKRIEYWLNKLDEYASGWIPSQHLFLK